MLTSFDTLPADARIWIYQADRMLTADELQRLSRATEQFLTGWQAHGKDLQAAYRVEHNRFLIIGVDEAGQNATGCSIDSSVGFIKSMEQDLAVNFFDRNKVVYLIGENQHETTLKEFKELVKTGRLHPDTCIFNNAIVSKAELETGWLQPLSASWAARLMPPATV